MKDIKHDVNEKKFIRLGAGAGYAGDRIEPAVDLIEQGQLDYICFECLAERTIALANQRKLKDPESGYDEFLVHRMEHVLKLCVDKGVKLISNMGAANPEMAAKIIRDMAKERGINVKVAAVLGDDISDRLEAYMDDDILERDLKLSDIKEQIVSANAYMDSRGIVEALEHGADIVITGRVADPALYLGPLIYEFGWSRKDVDLLGKGILTGHLLECSSQVCGGYYAEPGYKEVPGLEALGFPYVDVREDGSMIIGKLPGTGGKVTEDTCKEQILYEIQDPANYLTPDCIADFSNVTVTDLGDNRVVIEGATGHKASGSIKVSIGYRDGFLGEGQISYGGSGCLGRARMAGQIIEKRLRDKGIETLKVDFIGYNSLFRHPEHLGIDETMIPEVRLRVAAKCADRDSAQIIGNEVEALYLNGPAGGGGAEKYVREIIAIGSIFVPEDDIHHKVLYEVTQ